MSCCGRKHFSSSSPCDSFSQSIVFLQMGGSREKDFTSRGVLVVLVIHQLIDLLFLVVSTLTSSRGLLSLKAAKKTSFFFSIFLLLFHRPLSSSPLTDVCQELVVADELTPHSLLLLLCFSSSSFALPCVWRRHFFLPPSRLALPREQ